jgi:hypothetical protein
MWCDLPSLPGDDPMKKLFFLRRCILVVIILVFGLQFFCGLQLYAQQADSGANAAPKGAEFITWDVPGSSCEVRFITCTTSHQSGGDHHGNLC